MAVMFSGPFASLFNLQQTLDASRASSWLESGPSGSGSYPPSMYSEKAMISWFSSNSRASRSRIWKFRLRTTLCASLAARQSTIPKKPVSIVARDCPANFIERSRFRFKSMLIE